MKIYAVDEYGSMHPLKNQSEADNGKITPNSLKEQVREMALMADVEIISPSRGCVRVHKNIGTSMMLATTDEDHAWLQFNCIKKEDKGSCTIYHFVFD
jgi:hypothetical protein